MSPAPLGDRLEGERLSIGFGELWPRVGVDRVQDMGSPTACCCVATQEAGNRRHRTHLCLQTLIGVAGRLGVGECVFPLRVLRRMLGLGDGA